MEEKKQQSKRTGTSPSDRTTRTLGKTGTAAVTRAPGTVVTRRTSGKKTVAPSSPGPPDAIAARREESKRIALAVARAALDKKAERIEIVDIGEKVDYADYLVVMTGRSDRQVKAIANAIEEALEKQRGLRVMGREGLSQGHWVLLDYGDVIVHVFLDEARKFYDLEGLWLDAPRVPTPTFTPAPAAAPEV